LSPSFSLTLRSFLSIPSIGPLFYYLFNWSTRSLHPPSSHPDSLSFNKPKLPTSSLPTRALYSQASFQSSDKTIPARESLPHLSHINTSLSHSILVYISVLIHTRIVLTHQTISNFNPRTIDHSVAIFEPTAYPTSHIFLLAINCLPLLSQLSDLYFHIYHFVPHSGTFNPPKRLLYHHWCGTALSCHLIFWGCRKQLRMGQVQLRPAYFLDMLPNPRPAIQASLMVPTARTNSQWEDMEIDILAAEPTFLR
jgi:hypothetical protein